MILRDAMLADASRVFLNLDEFAELISIEDVPQTPAICDWLEEPGGEHLYGSPGDTWGVNSVYAEISLGEGVIPQPEPGQELIVNNRAWIVSAADTRSGLLHLKLYRNVA